VTGNSSTARKTAGLPAWLRTNVDKASNGSNPTLSATTDGYPNAARTDGTQRAITETMLKTVIASMWAEGGKPKIVMCGGFNKRAISAFTGLANSRFNIETNAKPTTIVGAADIYVSDFGNVRVVPNRLQRDRDVFVLDPQFAEVVYLRPYMTVPLAKTGDATRTMLLVEYGLKVKNEAAHGIIADLTTS
jgi:hypothetical protein